MATRPLIGPRADVLLFLAPVLLIPFSDLLVETFHLPLWGVFLAYDVLLLYPHFVATFPVAYGNGAWRGRPWTHLATPALLAAAIAWMWESGHGDGLWQVRYYWGLVHGGHQFAWMMHYHRLLDGIRSRGRFLLEWGAIALSAIAVLQILMGGAVFEMGNGLTLRILNLSEPVAVGLGIVSALSGGAVFLLLLRDRRGGRSILYPGALLATIAAAFGMVAIVATDPGRTFRALYLGIIGWHNVQYIAWTWLVHRDRRTSPFPAGRSWGGLFFYWLLLATAGIVLYYVLGFARAIVLGSSLALLHFYFDDVIWHRKETEEWFRLGTVRT